MVTNDMREMRALFNLARNEDMTVGQLHCASVDNPTLTRLADAGAIVVAPLGRWRITNAGRVLLNTRIVTGAYATIAH